MIRIQIIRETGGFIKGFTVEGHAGYAESGSDIICAAVSAVGYTALGALAELAGVKNHRIRDGYMKCRLPDELSGERKQTAGIILETAAIGFKQIENSYDGYITVLDEEV